MQRALDLTQLRLPIPDLPPDLDGFRLAHLSDFHRGPGAWSPVHTARARSLLLQLDPDVVINSGDFVQHNPLGEAVAEVAEQFALPGGEGGPRNIAILGNHDYFLGPDGSRTLRRVLGNVGLVVLENTAVAVQRGDATLTFVGLTAEEAADRRFGEGLELLLSSPRPRIAIIHEPDLAEHLPAGSADLVLAGHTHGGQVVLPGLRRWTVRKFCGSEYVHGLYHVGGMPMYVNRGLGCTGFPFRWRAAPELSVITLCR